MMFDWAPELPLVGRLIVLAALNVVLGVGLLGLWWLAGPKSRRRL
jgi:hypothetical protein